MRMLSRIAVVVALAFTPAALQAQTVAVMGHPSSDTISRVADVFRTTMQTQGMAGTAAAIQRCYINDGQPQNLVLLSSCILWNTAAMRMDAQVRQTIVANGATDPGPAAPFLSAQAYAARRSLYGRQAFGPDPAALDRYLGDTPGQVLALMVKRSRQ